jgi:hypothetical protein
MITIEGDSNSVFITVLSEKGDGYTGVSASISKKNLINELIQEGVLKDGETVYFEDDAE